MLSKLLAILAFSSVCFGQSQSKHLSSFGGLSVRYDSTKIDDGDAQEAVNVITDDALLQTRPGSLSAYTEGLGPIEAQYDYVNASGNNFRVIQSSGSILSNGNIIASSTAPISVVQAFSYLYVTNGIDSPFYYDGVSTAAVTSMPKCKYLETWKNRLYCVNTATETAKMYVSLYNNATTYAVPSSVNADSPMQVYFGKDDGQPINCALTTPRGVFIGKDRSTYLWSGTDSTNFTIRLISSKVGCITRSAKLHEGRILWLAQDGDIYSLDINNGLTDWESVGIPLPISLEISPLTKKILQSTTINKSHGDTFYDNAGKNGLNDLGIDIASPVSFANSPDGINRLYIYDTVLNSTSTIIYDCPGGPSVSDWQPVNVNLDKPYNLTWNAYYITSPSTFQNIPSKKKYFEFKCSQVGNFNYIYIRNARGVTTDMSPTYDTGKIAPLYKIIRINGTGISLSTHAFYTSDDGITFSSMSVVDGTVVPDSFDKRYYKFRIDYSAHAPLYSLDSLRVSELDRTTYYSTINALGQSYTMKNFVVDFTQSTNSLVSFYVSTDTLSVSSASATWQLQTPNAPIGLTSQYFRYKIVPNIVGVSSITYSSSSILSIPNVTVGMQGDNYSVPAFYLGYGIANFFCVNNRSVDFSTFTNKSNVVPTLTSYVCNPQFIYLDYSETVPNTYHFYYRVNYTTWAVNDSSPTWISLSKGKTEIGGDEINPIYVQTKVEYTGTITTTTVTTYPTLIINSVLYTYGKGISYLANSLSYDHRYFLTVSTGSNSNNDTIFVYQKNKKWTTFTGLNCYSLGLAQNVPYCGQNGHISEIMNPIYNTDNGVAIQSAWTTKDFIFDVPNINKTMRNAWIDMAVTDNSGISIYSTTDFNPVKTKSLNIANISGTRYNKNIDNLFDGFQTGKFFNFRIIGSNFKLNDLSLYYDVEKLTKD